MDKQLKFEIITEGQKYGVTAACKKYNISRTLYYRWLKRYKTHGINGLDKIEKSFTPVNKTKPEIVSTILNLIKKHPKFGPREIKYLLEEIGYEISESAVYNVMSRNNLTRRSQRLKFANKTQKQVNSNYPDFDRLQSGECWLCWATFCGDFEGIGSIYAYTILDYKSKVSCTRLYKQLSMKNFEDILTALAIPVAQSLSAEGKHLCFFEGNNIIEKGTFSSDSFIQHFGYDINVYLLKESDDLTEVEELRKDYTHNCLSFLMPLIYKGVSFNELKIRLQTYIRDYNINKKLSYDEGVYSPVEYHSKLTNSGVILPIWAYIERQY